MPKIAWVARGQVGFEPHSAEPETNSVTIRLVPRAGKDPRPAALLTGTHSFQVQEEELGVLAGQRQPLPRAQEPRKRGHGTGTGKAAAGDTARPQQQLIVRLGRRHNGTLSQLLSHSLI